MKICIDPGHGGSDPGACAGGAEEKYIALGIGLKLKKLLLANGFEVVMTRQDDRFDTPKKKAQIGNQAKADLFVSIHCNSSTSEQAHGTETLVYAKEEKAYEFGLAVQKELIAATGLTDRGVKIRPELIVLNSTAMPAILLETAFISNKEERLDLITDGFQMKVARAICKGICSCCGKKEKEDNEMEKRYQGIKELPEWARPIIQKLVDEGKIADGKHLDLTMDMVRTIVILSR